MAHMKAHATHERRLPIVGPNYNRQLDGLQGYKSGLPTELPNHVWCRTAEKS